MTLKETNGGSTETLLKDWQVNPIGPWPSWPVMMVIPEA